MTPRRPLPTVAGLLLPLALLLGCGVAPLPEAAHGDDESDLSTDAALASYVPPAGDGLLVSPGIELVQTIPTAARRGPVALRIQVHDDDGAPGELHLERATPSGWVPARTVPSDDSEAGRVTWDSAADAPFDGVVWLRARVTDPQGDAATPFAVEVRNAATADRIILVSHKLAPLAGGGAGPDGTELSAFRWRGSGTGGVLGAARRLTVGTGPSILRAAPHGRAAAVLEETSFTLSLIETPLDAQLAGVRRRAVVKLPHGSPLDARWSPDGRFLYVSGDGTAPLSPTLWRFEPSEDLSTVGPPVALAKLPGPATRFDVDRVKGRLLLHLGSGGVAGARPRLLMLSSAGATLASLDLPDGHPTALVVSPSGDEALWAGSFAGDELRRYQLGKSSIAQKGATLSTVPVPFDVVFHPRVGTAGRAALVSNLDKNAVTSLVLRATSIQPGPQASSIPLAAEVDLIERGAQAGLVFVSSLTTVARVNLGVDGSVSGRSVAIDLGAGTRNLTFGVAVQR